jgi:hypothetical protein
MVMTQQHLVGELSALIGDLHPVSKEELTTGVRVLRRRVESAQVGALGPLAAEAEAMADVTCWASLDEGDTRAFERHATTAALLHEFAANANLLP